MKYTYTINLKEMEEVYFSNTQRDFFTTDEERNKFNAHLVVEADNEQEADKMRMGITDIRMWEIVRTEG